MMKSFLLALTLPVALTTAQGKQGYYRVFVVFLDMDR
jgi:hypothetical protein